MDKFIVFYNCDMDEFDKDKVYYMYFNTYKEAKDYLKQDGILCKYIIRTEDGKLVVEELI